MSAGSVYLCIIITFTVLIQIEPIQCSKFSFENLWVGLDWSNLAQYRNEASQLYCLCKFILWQQRKVKSNCQENQKAATMPLFSQKECLLVTIRVFWPLNACYWMGVVILVSSYVHKTYCIKAIEVSCFNMMVAVMLKIEIVVKEIFYKNSTNSIQII